MPDDKDKPGQPNTPGLQNPPAKTAGGAPNTPAGATGPAPAATGPASIPPEAVNFFAQLAAQHMSVVNKPSAARVDADECVPGGHFVTAEGDHVNAWGEPFREGRDGSADNPELPRNIR